VSAAGGLDFFHTGLVVDDIDASMKELAPALGVDWRPPMTITRRVRFDRSHERVMELVSVYTVQGPPYIELVRGIPGTLWSTEAGGRVHHLGFSTDRLDEACAQLERAGMRQVVCDAGEDGTFEVYAYYAAASGPYVEVMTTKARQARGI
jgi:hypothetical protein